MPSITQTIPTMRNGNTLLTVHTVRRTTMSKDRVMIELDEYLLTQEEDYIDPAERKREMAERAADEAMSTGEEKLPSV
tara:strand:- start:812 stop:1045 length:234 start_codon:yes stop_codon:yes gene_type:complete